MVELRGAPWDKDLTLTEASSTSGSRRKVGVLRRKASGKVYESPRIVLDSEFKALIGKRFETFRGRAIYTEDTLWNEHLGETVKLDADGMVKTEVDCLILLFPDEKT